MRIYVESSTSGKLYKIFLRFLRTYFNNGNYSEVSLKNLKNISVCWGFFEKPQEYFSNPTIGKLGDLLTTPLEDCFFLRFYILEVSKRNLSILKYSWGFLKKPQRNENILREAELCIEDSNAIWGSKNLGSSNEECEIQVKSHILKFNESSNLPPWSLGRHAYHILKKMSILMRIVKIWDPQMGNVKSR